MTSSQHTVLVTGASGFVGRHLVRYLSKQGQQVRALYHATVPDEELTNLKGVTWQQCDLLDIYDIDEAIKGIEDIYHCAAIVSFKSADKQRMLHFNIEATANLVNAALEKNIRKLAFISSIASLGRKAGVKEITEEEQWEDSKNNSAYSYSKYCAELEVWRGIGEGLNAVIVNPGIILGEGDWNDGSARLLKIAYNQFPFYTEGINGWVDVADVIRICYELMQSEVSGERFILSEGNYAYRHIFTMMANELGRKPPHIKANSLMTGMVWRWNMIKHKLLGGELTITRETARTSQKLNYYNNSKLFTYMPNTLYTPMQQTISRMAAAFLSDQKRKN